MRETPEEWANRQLVAATTLGVWQVYADGTPYQQVAVKILKEKAAQQGIAVAYVDGRHRDREFFLID